MEMQELINMFVNNGLAVTLVAFYLLKDYKFNNSLVQTLETISNRLERLEGNGK